METFLVNLRNRSLTGASNTTDAPATESLNDFDLGGIDCQDCKNTGLISRLDESGKLVSRECPCMNRRRAMRRIRQSGMSDLIRRYTFENYHAENGDQKKILEKARQFAEADEGWFCISGQSGAGKSHICTAICARLIERNRDVYYMAWRDESTKLKSLVTDTWEYERRTQRLKRVEVLYVDDFLKVGDTDADIRLAYEILNFRYNDTRLRTILSSEITLEQLKQRDEALCGRIYERARGFVLQAPATNMRFQVR